MRPFLSIATATLLSCLLCFANPAQAETKAYSAGIINAAQRIMDMQGRQRQEKSRRIFEEGMKTGNSLITVYGSALLGFHYLLETDPDSALFYLNFSLDYYKASEYLMDALKHCDKDLDGTINSCLSSIPGGTAMNSYGYYFTSSEYVYIMPAGVSTFDTMFFSAGNTNKNFGNSYRFMLAF